MNKKKVLSLALVVIMIAILSFSTLAWFTDNESVKNDFQIAGSDDDTADEIFSVDVWEDRNGDGVADNELTGEEEGLNYKDILPGDVLDKVVYVKNTGYYDQYIRVTVKIDQAAIWAAALGSDFNDATLQAMFGGFDITAWGEISTKVENNQIVVTMYYNDILAVGGDIVVFDTVNIPNQLTREQAAYMGANGFSITVTADAVQTENLGIDLTDGICDAYQAFAVVEA